MTVTLEGISIIVRLEKLDVELRAEEGFLTSTAWHDRNLYCEAVATATQAGDRVEVWARRGCVVFVPGTDIPRWADLCVVSSGLGPDGACDWLEYDPLDDVVWLKGTEREAACGGRLQYRELRQKLASLREMAEAAYGRMYDASQPKDERDSALEFLARAKETARRLNEEDAAREIDVRSAHIDAVFRSQFRR